MYTYPFFPKLPSHSSCYGACQCWSLLTSWDPVCLVTLFGRKSLFKEWGSMTYFFKTQNQHRLFWSILHKKCIYSPYLINPLYIHTHTHIYMYIYVYIHTHIYMYIYICTWIHIYIYGYIYIHIYIYGCISIDLYCGYSLFVLYLFVAQMFLTLITKGHVQLPCVLLTCLHHWSFKACPHFLTLQDTSG